MLDQRQASVARFCARRRSARIAAVWRARSEGGRWYHGQRRQAGDAASFVRDRFDRNLHSAASGIRMRKVAGTLTLELPTVRPDVLVPVIEIFLKD